MEPVCMDPLLYYVLCFFAAVGAFNIGGLIRNMIK